MTGNFVLIGASLAQPSAGVLAKLLALPVFILAVAATRIFERQLSGRSRSPGGPVLIVQVAGLGVFLGLGLAASPIVDPDAPLAVAAGLSGVFAMGVQNAASRTVFSTLSPTTVMTGNVTQLTLDAVDLVQGDADTDRSATAARLRKMLPPVLWFASGAVLGGLCFALLGFFTLAAPILSTLIVVALAGRPRLTQSA